MSKTIMIFGAGLNQLTLIKSAKNLGYRSVVLDPSILAPGKDLADEFFVVEPNDYERTKQIAIDRHVDGIVTAQMENPLRLMAQLAKELGFVFNSPEIVGKCRNKYLMKQAFLKNGIACANGIHFNREERPTVPLLTEKNLSFPLIVKPVDSHSSRGVYKVDCISDLLRFIPQTIEYSTTGDYLVEEFLDGPEYSVETITFNGKTSIIQFTEKRITNYPYTVELGHIQPANLSVDVKADMESLVLAAIEALGINNSAAHAEVKVTEGGIKVVEIGARLGGDYISSYLTACSTGYNMDAAAIEIALGIRPTSQITKSAFSMITYLSFPEGKTVKTLPNLNDSPDALSIAFWHFLVKIGDVIPFMTDSAKRPGFFIIESDSRDNLEIISSRITHYIYNNALLI